LVARYRHKFGAVVADIHGVSARAMVRGLIEGQSPAMLLSHTRGALKRKTEDLAASLDGDLSEHHLFVLRHLSQSTEALQRQLSDIDAYLMRAMQPYAWAHSLLQTIPGIDEIAAALILIEIGDDMARFGAPQRLACWAALSPGNNEGAGKRKSGRTRHGNNPIRYILCKCANAARMTKSTLASKFKSLMVRKSHKKAIGRWPAARAPAANAATRPTAEHPGSGPADTQSMPFEGRLGHVATSGGFHGNVRHHRLRRQYVGQRRICSRISERASSRNRTGFTA
jgi:transposase